MHSTMQSIIQPLFRASFSPTFIPPFTPSLTPSFERSTWKSALEYDALDEYSHYTLGDATCQSPNIKLLPELRFSGILQIPSGQLAQREAMLPNDTNEGPKQNVYKVFPNCIGRFEQIKVTSYSVICLFRYHEQVSITGYASQMTRN
jgi:hypothetical protein